MGVLKWGEWGYLRGKRGRRKYPRRVGVVPYMYEWMGDKEEEEEGEEMEKGFGKCLPASSFAVITRL